MDKQTAKLDDFRTDCLNKLIEICNERMDLNALDKLVGVMMSAISLNVNLIGYKQTINLLEIQISLVKKEMEGNTGRLN